MIQLKPVNTKHIENETIVDGRLQVLPYAYWQQFDLNTRLTFMHKNAYYIIPTTELIEFLRTKLIAPAIEIGAGNGYLGRALGVPITDNKMQEITEIRLMYALSGQPTIHYPEDVEKLDAVDAVIKYKPATVVGSYITCKYNESVGMGNAMGVDDQFVVNNCQRYIMIGNKSVEAHYKNPLMQKPHEEHYFEWLITRAVNQEQGRIFIWNKP